MNNSDDLYINDKFKVGQCSFRDPVLEQEVRGYSVVNIATGIREAETRRFFFARMLCDKFEKELLDPKDAFENAMAAPAANDPGLIQ